MLVAASDRHRRGDCGIDTSRDAKKGLFLLSRPSFDSADFLYVSFVQDTLLVVIFVLDSFSALFRIIAVGKRNR